MSSRTHRHHPMIRTRPLTEEDISVMAVVALDELVTELVRASGLRMAPAFLDWVADVATQLVDTHVVHSFSQPRFTRSLHMGDPRIALARWVRHWVCPHIVRQFGELAVYLPEFAESRPVELACDVATSRPLQTVSGSHRQAAWSLQNSLIGTAAAPIS